MVFSCSRFILGTVLTSVLSVLAAANLDGAEYRNPVSAQIGDAWEDYGFGDPFVMRYNGRYYLYPSTRDDQVGVKCWSSRDLVSWRYEGLCAVDPTTKGAYAPEIFRGHDAFYMATSPAGKGHYIYRSESPTGPFERATDNFGLSIDGSVFIDDGGEGYFYSASDRGILAYRMTSETQVDPRPIETGLFMRGWTEGPTVFKNDGVYYATYTGNHVFSRGYRINAGAGDSPVKFAPCSNNPILLSTEGKLFGIGHNSVVKGPNLDLYYVVYHSLVGRGRTRGWPVREMNIDRLVLNKGAVYAVGPTRESQTVPGPDVGYWPESDADLDALRTVALEDGTRALATHETVEGDFTAEFNLAFRSDSGKAGALFCCADARNWGRVSIEPASGQMEIATCLDGEIAAKCVPIPKSFGQTVSFALFRSVQVERTGRKFTVSVDDRRVAEFESGVPSGAIGYFSDGADAAFGFIGATRATGGSSARSLAERVPGQAVAAYRVSDRGARPQTVEDGNKSIDALELTHGDSLTFDVVASEAGVYDVALRCRSLGASAASIAAADGLPLSFELPPGRQFNAAVCRGVSLPTGTSRVTVACERGSFLVDKLEFRRADSCRAVDFFSEDIDKPGYSDGSWRVKDGVLTSAKDCFGKRLYGESGWGDYAVEADVTFLDSKRAGGLLVRAAQPALGGPGNSPKLGSDFLLGYYVSLGDGEVVLTRLAYESRKSVRAPVAFDISDKVKLRVEALENRIEVFVDGMSVLVYGDPEPFIVGRVGVRTCGSKMRFENLRVEPLSSGRLSRDGETDGKNVGKDGR